MQLSRLQTVDVNRPLVARVFGFAALRIEVAGAGDSRADLRYLTVAEADALRSGSSRGPPAWSTTSARAPEQPLLVVPYLDLLVSLLLRAATVFLLLATILIVVSRRPGSAAGAAFSPSSLGGVPLLMVFTEFSQLYNFSVARSARWRASAARFAADRPTIPPGRVSAVEFDRTALLAPPRMGQAVRHRGWVGREDDDRHRIGAPAGGTARSRRGTLRASCLVPPAGCAVAVAAGQGPSPLADSVAPPRRGCRFEVAVLKRGRVTVGPRSCTTPVFSPCG